MDGGEKWAVFASNFLKYPFDTTGENDENSIGSGAVHAIGVG